MSSPQAADDPVSDLFRDIVLVLGGAFAARGTDDETILQVARGLERAWRRACVKRSPTANGGPAPIPHPAITALLRLTEERA